jgi:hypothetical protein
MVIIFTSYQFSSNLARHSTPLSSNYIREPEADGAGYILRCEVGAKSRQIHASGTFLREKQFHFHCPAAMGHEKLFPWDSNLYQYGSYAWTSCSRL